MRSRRDACAGGMDGHTRTRHAVPAALHGGGQPALEASGGVRVRGVQRVLDERAALGVARHPSVVEPQPPRDVVVVQPTRQVRAVRQQPPADEEHSKWSCLTIFSWWRPTSGATRLGVWTRPPADEEDVCGWVRQRRWFGLRKMENRLSRVASHRSLSRGRLPQRRGLVNYMNGKCQTRVRATLQQPGRPFSSHKLELEFFGTSPAQTNGGAL